MKLKVRNEDALSGQPTSGRPVVEAGTVLFAEIKQLGEPIKVRITEWNIGGLLTRVEGLRAFLPNVELVDRVNSFTDLKDKNWAGFITLLQKLSKFGKDARASQAHAHFNGATSFANRRADLEKERGKFSELDFYKRFYTRKDGSYKEGTLSRQFLEDAKIKVNENLASFSSSKSRVDIENAVFNDLMYKGEIPKRPLNYGFGVKQSDIFGVEGLLRKEGSSYVNLNAINHNVVEVKNLKAELSAVKKHNQALENKVDETTQTFKMIASHFAHELREVHNGNATTQLLQGAESVIHFIDSQIPNVTSTDGEK